MLCKCLTTAATAIAARRRRQNVSQVKRHFQPLSLSHSLKHTLTFPRTVGFLGNRKKEGKKKQIKAKKEIAAYGKEEIDNQKK
jgi:hypothetical protein